MTTVHFDCRHLHSANELDIYIDGVKRCTVNGGETRSVKVTPGSHTISVQVYNDAAERAYWLGPWDRYFEAGTEYDMTIGKSGDGGSGGSGGGGGSANPGTGCGCLILIIIAVALFSGLRSCVGSLFTPSPSKNTPPAQVTESPEVPTDEIPETRYTEENGFIFPNSDMELIEQWEAESLSDQDLTYAINELYARRGYIFRSDELRGYYEQFSWYIGTIPADEFSVEVFNQIEQQNWRLLVNERDARRASD